MKQKNYFLLFLLPLIFASSLYANPLPPTTTIPYQQGNFYYGVSEGTVTIVKYTGSGGNVVIPDTLDGMPVVRIGSYAFYNCPSLTSVTIPDSVTSIWEAAFEGCSGLTSVTIPDSVWIIGSWAFMNCTSLTSIVIPNSVTNIGSSVFAGCTGLTSVTIPDSVTRIEYNAFYNCNSLVSVTIPNSVTSIGNYAFDGCSSLTSLTIGNSVTSIDYYAFNKCTALTSVTIPSSVTNIGKGAFANCTSMTSIVVDANNTNYSSQDGVLYNKAKTVLFEYPAGKSGRYTIPASVTSIGYEAFFHCIGLTSVTLPDIVTSIGDSAFYGCTSLTSVTIPDNVTSIGYEVFYGCTGMTSIDVDTKNPSYSSQDGVLYDKNKTILYQYPCGKTGEFTIPGSVTNIGDEAFGDCSELTGVTIGNGVTSIGGFAFLRCPSLTSVTIPDSVTSIGVGAFQGCSGLTKANFLGNAPSMGNVVFYNCSSNFIVCYTAGSTGFTTPTWIYNSNGDSCSAAPCAVPTSSTSSVPSTTTTQSVTCDILSINPQIIKIGLGLIPRIKKITLTLDVDLEASGITADELSFENAPKGIFILQGSVKISGSSAEAVVLFWGVKLGTYNVNLGPCGSIPLSISRF